MDLPVPQGLAISRPLHGHEPAMMAVGMNGLDLIDCALCVYTADEARAAHREGVVRMPQAGEGGADVVAGEGGDAGRRS